MSTLNISPSEQTRIDKLGLLVSMHGSSFVVRHQRLKRQRFEAGNLSMAITSAQMALEALDKKNGKPKDDKPKITVVEAPNSVAVEAGPPSDRPFDKPIDRALLTPVPDSKKVIAKPKKTKITKPKRAQGDWKTYQVGKLILTSPDKTPEEILAMCKEQRIETKLMTVIGLTRYFRLCIRIMADIAKEKEAANG
jgi:hypothetical protein